METAPRRGSALEAASLVAWSQPTITSVNSISIQPIARRAMEPEQPSGAILPGPGRPPPCREPWVPQGPSGQPRLVLPPTRGNVAAMGDAPERRLLGAGASQTVGLDESMPPRSISSTYAPGDRIAD